MPQQHVLIIGGGVVGAMSAYHLSRDGHCVTIIDQGKFGAGCSHGNCGYVCPSHALPLPQPGAISTTLKAMLKPDAPLYIKPRLDPRLWSWLLHFARRCNETDMMAAARARVALLNASKQLYLDLLKEEQIDCDWEERGLLFVYQSQREMDKYAATDALLREHFDLAAVRYDGDALSELEPALKPGLAGAWHYEGDAHLRADKLMADLRRVLEGRGVNIREHVAFRGFARSAGRAWGAATDAGEIPADAFVVATGATAALLDRELGVKIPIQPGKGYSITMPRPAACPTRPMIFEEHKVAITPFKSGYRIGSTMEFAGYDTTLNRKRLDALKRGAAHYLTDPYGPPGATEQEWFGWRPMTYDDVPILGPLPSLANVHLAVGHGMLGVSMAPATGRLIADLIGGKPPVVDAAPYSVARFA